MGLVSSSNIIIANSTANRNNGVDIHASLLALNESFVMHFWQNSVQNYQTAPMSDGRGVDIYGVNNIDHRGIIRLWGGIIQEFRGYMMRGGIGFPYNGNNMGTILGISISQICSIKYFKISILPINNNIFLFRQLSLI